MPSDASMVITAAVPISTNAFNVVVSVPLGTALATASFRAASS
jgi:hypothetical protein